MFGGLTNLLFSNYDTELIDDSKTGDFNWDETTQGYILGGFFYGYTAGNFIGGRAAEYLGGRLVFGLGVMVSSFLSIFSAPVAYVSKDLFIVLRVLEGLTQAVVYPSLHFLMSGWLPPSERGSLGAIVFSGSTLGTIIAMALGGWLCQSSFLGGWPSVFYIFGVVGVLWGLPWYLLVHDLPEIHPSIHQHERDYIVANRTLAVQKRPSLPWRDIATSLPFWSLMVMSFGYNYVYYLFLTELPTYFSNVQHYSVDNNGLTSALPYLVQWLTIVLWGLGVSLVTSKVHVPIKVVRKVSAGVGMYLCMAGLVAMVWVKCNHIVVVVVMCVAVGALGTQNSGAVLSEQDIAPNFSGSLKGLTNTVGAATGFIAPAVTGAIIKGNQTLSAWRVVFVSGAVLNFICTTQYMFLATDKVQAWNYPKPTKHIKEDNKL